MLFLQLHQMAIEKHTALMEWCIKNWTVSQLRLPNENSTHCNYRGCRV